MDRGKSHLLERAIWCSVLATFTTAAAFALASRVVDAVGLGPLGWSSMDGEETDERVEWAWLDEARLCR